MTDILLGPTIQGGPTTKVRDKKSGKIYYKKQILPVGKFQYKDQELDLSDVNLSTIAQSFKGKAYDEVAFQLGDENGAHNNDARRRVGTMVEVEHVPGKGMYGYFDLTAEGQKYVTDFPSFGVSPRIVASIARADGKKFDAAIEHICATNVPRITGMSPWEKIELSQAASADAGDNPEVLDFSTVTAQPTRLSAQTSLTNKVEGGTTDNKSEGTVELTQEQAQFLTEMMEDAKKFETAFGEGGGNNQQTTTPVIPAELSNGVSEAKTLSEQALAGLAALQEQARKDSWSAKKRELAGRGVPPAALDLADPIMLSAPSRVIDLSTAEGTVKSDEQQVTLSMLETMVGTVDLSAESGHGIGGSEPNDDSVRQEDIDAFLSEHGI